VTPGPFANVPEQVEAKRLLAAALGEGDAHAYLFHGPRASAKPRPRLHSRARCSATRDASLIAPTRICRSSSHSAT